MFARLWIGLGLLFWAAPAAAISPDPQQAANAAKAIAALRIPPGMKVELFAAHPQITQPVAICVDEQGRLFAAEQFRFNHGAEENRTRGFLLDDDLASQTVEDRLAMYQKYADKFQGGMAWFSAVADRVRRLEDKDRDGKADEVTIFADGFNQPLDGLAAGVIARDGDVYLTCIPNLWRLRDTNGDGQADQREALHTGFGVQCAYLGHDLHGLTWGPDGKLYFSIGDRGFHVTTTEGKLLHGPCVGGVFRCNPDGSELEVVYRGLRNPQELAFDDYGNLFADDNNCDKGDHARLVYIVEGGDTGWNMSYQTIAPPYETGPWHAEKMWHVAAAETPHWMLPAIAPLGAGPSGFAYYPGLGLPDRYAGHFFMANYTGNGGIESFALKPRGAGFEMTDAHDFCKPLQATDLEFGYDGKIYVGGFTLHWNGENPNGFLYTLFDPEKIKDPRVAEVAALFQAGFTQRPTDELAGLLSHADRRVRQRAQFALAARGAAAAPALENVLKTSTSQFARLHALWGLGQIARKEPAVADKITPLLADADEQVLAQAAKLAGDLQASAAAPRLIELLEHESPRVKFFAAQSLGKLGARDALAPVYRLLAANDDQDRFLRHAGVMALVGINDRDAVAARTKDENRAIRLASLLALRQWRDERIAQFLFDADLVLATEAARAINDLPLDAATPALAEALPRLLSLPQPAPEPLVRRAIHANFRLGEEVHARRVAEVVANAAQTPAMRAEALAALGNWSKPSARDRVTGAHRPLSQRDPAVVKKVLEAYLPQILASAAGPLQTQATEIITRLQLQMDEATFFGWVGDPGRDLATRIAALRLLAARNYAQLDQALAQALASDQPQLRAAARDVAAARDPARAVELLRAALVDAPLVERQLALKTLGGLPGEAATAILAETMDQLLAGKTPAELQLDILEAARAHNSPLLASKLAQYETQLDKNDPLAPYRASLAGGDAARGAQLFQTHATAQCLRCHKVGPTGGDAGPDLSQVSTRAQREHLLESLITPSAKIAPGFGTVNLLLDSGKVVAGVLRSETAEQLTIVTPQGESILVPTADIEERSEGLSLMPPMGPILKPTELRDLLEFLSQCK